MSVAEIGSFNMNSGDVVKVVGLGDTQIITIDPDIKTEISKKQIDGIVSDMIKHLLRKKKVHIIVVKE